MSYALKKLIEETKVDITNQEKTLADKRAFVMGMEYVKQLVKKQTSPPVEVVSPPVKKQKRLSGTAGKLGFISLEIERKEREKVSKNVP